MQCSTVHGVRCTVTDPQTPYLSASVCLHLLLLLPSIAALLSRSGPYASCSQEEVFQGRRRGDHGQ